MRLLPFAMIAMLLVGCEKQNASSFPTEDAARVDASCRAGQRSGSQCDAAQKALAEKEHRDAQSAFRSMGGPH